MRIRLADAGLEGVGAGQRADAAVEEHVVRPLVEHLVQVEGAQALVAALALEIEVALHHVELVVDLRQAALRLDDDQAVHAVGDVVGDHRRGAVVDVDARVERLEVEAGLAGRDCMTLAPPPGPVTACRSMLWVTRVGGVAQVDLDRVAFADAEHRAGHGAVEGPVLVGHAVGELSGDFRGRQVELDVGRLGARDRGATLGRTKWL